MNHPEICQDLQRLAAAVSKLLIQATDNQARVDVGDRFDTQVNLVYRRHTRLVHGSVRSAAGNASFELRLGHHATSFKHPRVGVAGELWAKALPAKAVEALNCGASDSAVAEKIARIARRLEHVSVLRRVQIGIREGRDTLPSLSLAS